MSGDPSERVRRTALERGALGLLAKPMGHSELLAAIGSALSMQA